MNPSCWIDTATSPPQPLPDSLGAALDYLAGATGHPVYTRWTLSRLKRGCPSLADAKREHPAVFALLLEHEAAVEYWDRGRLQIVAAEDAPPPETILERTLHQHRRRFHEVADGTAQVPASTAATPAATATTAVWLAALEPPATLAAHDAHATRVNSVTSAATSGWLARAGRFVNPSMVTNTLGVADDAQAVILFLRDRAGRSPHTRRAYLADLRRLIAWCEREKLGPLSDLTRHDLLAYRREVEQAPATRELRSAGTCHPARHGRPVAPRERSAAVPARALAVVSSLFRYWLKTGYLIANPAADLSGGLDTEAHHAGRRHRPVRRGDRRCCARRRGPASMGAPLCDLVAVPLRGRAPRGTGVVRIDRPTAARCRGRRQLDPARARQGKQAAGDSAAGRLSAAATYLPALPGPHARTGRLRTAAAHSQREARCARGKRPVRRGQGGLPRGRSTRRAR
jgi:integrase/recombinase XerC